MTRRSQSPPVAVPHAVYVGAVVVALVGAVVGLMLYQRQPDPFPTHFGFDGTPDAWSPRSVGAVLAPQFVAMAVSVLMWGVATLIAGLPQDPPPTGALAATPLGRFRSMQVQLTGLAWLALVIAAGITWLNVEIWLFGRPGAWTLAAMLLGLAAVLGWMILTCLVRTPGTGLSSDRPPH